MNTYHPKVCGDCRFFMVIGDRSDRTGGRLPGVCTKLELNVTRTDWCQEPEELENHKTAKLNYGLLRSESDDED